MEASALAPAVFSIIGVALGTIGSLIGVYAAQRTTREQARIQRDAALRAERREVILEYLSSVQDCWFFLAHRRSGFPVISRSGVILSGDDLHLEQTERNRSLLYAQQKINLAVSLSVRQAAQSLTTKIDAALGNPDLVKDGIDRFLAANQQEFLAAARLDLGLHDGNP